MSSRKIVQSQSRYGLQGGFIHARHDNLRNLEAALLSEVYKDVAAEPHLQPVTGEEFDLRSAKQGVSTGKANVHFSLLE